MPGDWAQVSIAARGDIARLVARYQAQPTPTVDDVTTGRVVRGTTALRITPR